MIKKVPTAFVPSPVLVWRLTSAVAVINALSVT